MTREEFFNRMLALHAFDASLFEDAGAGMYNLDLYETDGVIFDYPLQQTIVQVYFNGNFEGLIYYLCYYKNDYDNWDSECLEPNELLFDTIFKNILKEYKLNFEVIDNLLIFAYKETKDMEKKLYNVQINVDAYLKIPVVATNEGDAVNMALNIFTDMKDEEVRKGLHDVKLIEQTIVEDTPTEIHKENMNGRLWDAYPYLHKPDTRLPYYTNYNIEEKDDWYVMDTEIGELWMNNVAGYMYILDKKNKITYVTLF